MESLKKQKRREKEKERGRGEHECSEYVDLWILNFKLQEGGWKMKSLNPPKNANRTLG